jgi:CheY-like chemotaxis protein
MYSISPLGSIFLEPTCVSFKILIVEDNSDSRNLLNLCLSNKGFHIVTANNGTEGLSLAQAEKPDLIITDIFMPITGGVEMIRQIRAEPELALTPIVLYTAQILESVENAIQAGANKAFYKPLDIDEMIQYISVILNNSAK